MNTLWERVWNGGDRSLSVEQAPTTVPEYRGAQYLFLLLIDRRLGRMRAAHVGVLRRGRLPVGVAGLVRGRLRTWPRR